MKHLFFEGSVYHKRFIPTVHEFTYPFYLLDINLNSFKTLGNKLFSINRFNLFSFKSSDHFGTHKEFNKNVLQLLDKFDLDAGQEMHFLTLPRVFNFVFNPISLLVLFTNEKPTHLLAEVNNYNGGKVVYKVTLNEASNGIYKGISDKDMHVSPFFDRNGIYKFTFSYSKEKMDVSVTLYEAGEKKLVARFNGHALPFTVATLWRLLWKQTFLTFKVVTRTLWQSFKLWKKGLKWYSPLQTDQIRRY